MQFSCISPRNRLLTALAVGILIANPDALMAQRGGGGGGGGKNKASLSVSVTPDSFSESDEAGAAGIVTRENSALNVPLTVTITSSDPGKVILAIPGSIEDPAGEISVQIPIGEASAVFNVVAVNDAVKDGDQSVTISVSATDHSGASASITVLDDESLPQIAYVPTVIPMPLDIDQIYVNDINDWGIVGGYCRKSDGLDTVKHAIIYDPEAETPLIDLQEDLVFPDWDYENWVIASVVGINNNGLAVGYAELISDPSVRQGFVIDLYPDPENPTTPPQIYELPETDQGWPFSYARKVNDNGDILGMYRRADDTEGFYLVNLGLRGGNAYPLETTPDDIIATSASLTEPTVEKDVQVVSRLLSEDLMVYTQGGPDDVRIITGELRGPDTNVDGDIAAISTSYEVVPLKGKKTQTVTRYELFREIDDIQEYIPLTGFGRFVSINSAGTVFWRTDVGAALYSTDYGLLNLESLVITPVPMPLGSVHTNDFIEDGFSEIAYGRTDPDTLEASLIILTPFPLP